MRMPDLHLDGWRLEDGEERNSDSPDTFPVPPLRVRNDLRPGDFAKLIFNIAVDNEHEPIAVERMWVLITQRTSLGYIGVLDNEPRSIAKNDEFWCGIEVAFEPKHVIDARPGDDTSRSLIGRAPLRRWPPN